MSVTHDRYPYSPITERQGTLSEAAERALIAQATRAVEQHCGQPHRFKHLKRALKAIAGQADARVWFTTSGEIAKHAAALPPGTLP